MTNSSSLIFPDTATELRIVSAHTGEVVNFLKENGRYEYEVLSPEYQLREKSGVIRHSKIQRKNSCGTIEPGNFVGRLKLELLDRKSKTLVASAYLDVHSKKLNYETEYRSMLEDIADRCADFLLQIESPVEQFFTPDDEEKEATLAQRLYFLKSLLGGEDFQMAIQRILAMPNTQWQEESRSVDVRRSGRLGRAEVRQLASGGRRIAVPASHSLYSTMHTIPERIEVVDKRDTVDTPENRFVKHALMMFLQTLEELQSALLRKGETKYPGLQSEITELIDGMDETLSHSVLKEVSQPDLLPLNSPVLQRKEGYRQVLRAWMLFELAAKLSWSGGDDVYAGGKRDAATLYEYWVFFKMLDLVANLFELDRPPVEDLINDKDLVLKLKAGKYQMLKGRYTGTGRSLRIKFSYNRTFSATKNYPQRGSWTRNMRPDYTLSLWPDGILEKEAEKQELMTHVHFDAKYKVNDLSQLFNADEDSSEENESASVGIYKGDDLLKMHAYRDAIRRTAGAYVIYPGSIEKSYHGFHELLPGLGAFPLRPGGIDDGSSSLAGFLKEVVAHVCNRASQREQHTYHTYRIYKDDPPDALHEALQEQDGDCRAQPSNEVFVIHGYYNGDEHLKWIASKGMYNYRTEHRRGSLRLHHSVAGASYLLVHGKGEYGGGGKLFQIVSDGPRVFSKETLIEKGYPGGASQPFYIVFDLKPLDKKDPLVGYDWDLNLIDQIGEGRQSAIPEKGIPLSDLMKGAVRK